MILYEIVETLISRNDENFVLFFAARASQWYYTPLVRPGPNAGASWSTTRSNPFHRGSCFDLIVTEAHPLDAQQSIIILPYWPFHFLTAHAYLLYQLTCGINLVVVLSFFIGRFSLSYLFVVVSVNAYFLTNWPLYRWKKNNTLDNTLKKHYSSTCWLWGYDLLVRCSSTLLHILLWSHDMLILEWNTMSLTRNSSCFLMLHYAAPTLVEHILYW